MSSKPLKVLVVEDNPEDVELMMRHLRRSGFAPEYVVTDTEEGFIEGLKGAPDIILSDFEMPNFSGMRALELFVKGPRKIPFIIVSGNIGEDVAVTAMRQGADDYLLKDRMARLGTAVEQALEKHRLRLSEEQGEKALRESEARFREVVETINEVFWVTEGWNGRLLYASPAYERIWGRPMASLVIPADWLETIHPEDRGGLVRALQERTITNQFSVNYRIIRPDGTVRWIRDRAFPVKDAEGRAPRIVGVAEDITENRQLEEQLLRTQRMEAIGTLAGGVSHDLNNILAPTLMAAELIRHKMTDPHGLQLVNMVEQSLKRGAGIIRQMLIFSRGVSGQRATVQPRHLLNEMETLIRETFPRDITLDLDIAKDLKPVVADATQLHQVLINLCVNARDAMPDGGTLTLVAKNAMIGTDEVRAYPQAKPGMHVVITVQDTGCGIPSEIQGRIFEPFFTTKEVGKGTGLGLSSVIGIVRSHGGFVSLDSAPGRGATFKVCLPVHPDEHEDKPFAAAFTAMPRGNGELVLVVDDEEIIRETTQHLLEGYGYRVLVASHGVEALELFKTHRGSVRLVLTDVMMPVMGGAQFIRHLRLLAPELPIIVSSGLLEADELSEFETLGVREILAKPYGVREFLSAIRGGLR